jgi:hypothetical protein
MSSGVEQSTEQQNKSGQQIAKENVEKVRAYIDHLKANGLHLPSRYGKPNWTAIARDCGLKDRGVFYDNDDARALIEQAVSEIGLEAAEQAGNKKAEHAEKRLGDSERHVQQLTEKLAVKVAENEKLRRKVAELEEKLRQYSVFEEIMTTSGRRYIP